ncbi:MAG: beta-L-arabinofuranosidase domain-containing protein [Paraglaciecola sp.]|uniref:glycoside hydrolase family 127 protein n=1 Tax=Paraglaciecola sp. TaxID=1920173 RepID=UPI0032978CDC
MNTLLKKGDISNAWTGGFWQERWNFCRDKMIPHMWGILNDKDISHCWENFRIASGDANGEHSDPPFWDGDLFKWLEGAIRAYANSDNQEWLDRIDHIIDTIATVQRDDGYIFTYEAIKRRKSGESSVLEDINNFEVYNMGHLMSAGVVHYKMTGQTKLLDLGKKAAAWLASQFANLDEATARTAVCPSHYMGLAELYQATEDEQYLTLLEKLILLRDMVPDGTDDNQDRHPLKEHREILGHGVRATYLYAGVTDLYMGKKDEDYRVVLEAVWNDMVTKKQYITGGCAPLYDGVSPYGSWEYDKIQRTHQSFGRAYELPNTTGYNETCATIGSYLWNYRMAKAFNQGKYGDQMERALYNSTISGINLAGDKYCYTNSLRCVHEHDSSHDLKWGRHREDFLSSFCCPPNLIRTLAGAQDKAAIIQGDGIAILMYGDCKMSVELPNGCMVTIREKTDYPWSGEIEFELESVESTEGFPLFLRIPEWAETFKAKLNGYVKELKVKDGFIELNHHWKAGDKVSLSLQMDVVVNESHHMVEENRNHVALTYGPIVYCLEATDLPKGFNVEDMYIDPASEFTFEKFTINSTELGSIKLALWAREKTDSNEDTLYRKYTSPKFEKVETKLVPYFAWDNRERGEMSVWLPLLPNQ